MMLHELVEQQVAASPEAPAVSDGTTRLTYAELDQRANVLANELVRRGVGPETPVGVLAERRTETVVAILATLKAGGAYLPIDPALPAARFAYVMADAGARFLVTPADRVETAARGDWALVPLEPTDAVDAGRPRTAVTEDHAAYILYTSGSTGEPKGVVVPHRQIVASTAAHSALGRPAPTRFLLLVGFSFDASGIGLYWTLSTGGHIVIPGSTNVLDAHALRELIRDQEITHVDCTPGHYSMMLADDPTPLSSVRFVAVGGEACPPDLVARHTTLLPGVHLANIYGPTENTVWATTADLLQEDPDGRVPIGRAVPGVRTYLLDRLGQPVPDGEVGELHLGGALVARGYHGQPGMTAERFVPDGFAPTGGARMYRTGDLARLRGDGQLEFSGRVDHQVKVRGFRVELGEVERVLARHDGVTEAVVDLRTLGGVPALVAWVQPTGPDVTVEDLIRQVADRLPDYMVPTRIVLVDAFPRMGNGKVARSELSTPSEIVPAGDDRPLTPLEEEVAAYVTAVLGIERISAHTSLFEAGATSLHITKLAFGLWQQYGTIGVHDLFQLPTVAGIAQVVAAAKHRSHAAGMEPWTFERMAAEGVLDPAITAEGLPSASWFEPHAVLVTGATGYLGAFLIRELVRRTEATIWCLVRARDEAHARERLEGVLREYLIWDDAFSERLRFVVGDLAEPRLGLDPSAWAALGETIDVIYHSGALVNFVYPYEHLKPANVGGTAEIFRLATTSRLKAVHFISSIDVMLHTDIPRPFLEDMELVPLDVPEHGYPRSKWVADHVARIARNRGIPCSIYRPGMMISNTETGATQASDFLLVQIRGLLEFGVMPEAEFLFDALPIDFVAHAITHISLKREVLGRNFHLWNLRPVHIAEVHAWILSFGYHFDMVSLQTAVQHLVTLDPSNPMYRMLPLMLADEVGRIPEAVTPEVASRIDFRAECRNTLAALHDAGLVPPEMTEELAHKCFQYFVDTGYLPSPEEQRRKLGRDAVPVAERSG